MIRRCLLLLLIAIATLLPRASHADDIDQDSRRAAHKLGLAAMQERNWEGAYDIYRSLWEERKAYDVALLLGQVELNLGRYRDAAEHLDFGIRHAPAREATELVRRAQKFYEEARRYVGILTVKVEPAKADILLDGMPLGVAPLAAPVFVHPGYHTLRAEYEGYEGKQQGFQVAAGERKLVPLSLGKIGAPEAAAPNPLPADGARTDTGTTPADNNASQSPVPAIVVGAVGVVALGTGIGLLIAASNKDSSRQDLVDEVPGTNECGPGTPFADECSEIEDLSSGASTFRTISYVSFGVAVGAGVATYFLWPRKNAAREGARVRPVLGATGTGAYAGFSGRF